MVPFRGKVTGVPLAQKVSPLLYTLSSKPSYPWFFTSGKAWKIGGPSFGLGRFIFFNVPNYLSPSPAQMLMPREVALKDNLNIRR
jgi:hypothetical protein